MTRNIQIRSVPSELHTKLKNKASLSGKTLTDFLMAELLLIADRPTISELKKRIQSRKPIRTKMSPTNVLRAERVR
jgi:hypothetical protein